MYDTSYKSLSAAQYEASVTAGTMAGYASPLHDPVNYQALTAASQRANIDPRIPLAVCWQEGHMGSDPNLVAAKVLNFGGIKWAGQPGAFDSGIPADTGGTYAGFPDSSHYWAETCRTLTNEFVGPYLRAGDVQGAFRKYTNWDNPASGDGKLAIYQWLLANEPVSGNVDGVYGEDLIVYLRTLIGQASSTAATDPVNGVHPWALWCESLAERVPEHAGLGQVRRGSAYLKGLACQAQGLFRADNVPQHGDWVIFDQRFYAPDGHIAFWDADKGQVLGTVTDGTGIGYRDWGPQTYGFMGCAPVPGVVAARRVHTTTEGYYLGGNPYGQIAMRDPFWARWDQANTLGVPLDHPGAINPTGIAMPMIGYPKGAEVALPDGRRVQQFERLTMMTQSAAAPWDVVALFPEEAAKYVK